MRYDTNSLSEFISIKILPFPLAVMIIYIAIHTTTSSPALPTLRIPLQPFLEYAFCCSCRPFLPSPLALRSCVRCDTGVGHFIDDGVLVGI